MGKLERLDAHRARMEAWLRNCFLEREPREIGRASCRERV